VLKRMKNVLKGKGNMAKEGIKICIETMERMQEIEGVKGVHVMVIEWEKKVGELVKGAGLTPRPTVEA